MIKTIENEDKKITIIGTAHISKKSSIQVKDTILKEWPQVVAIELDRNRLIGLLNKDKQKKPKFTDIFKTKDKGFFLISYFLSGFQKKIAEKFNTTPGIEMLAAIDAARQVNAKILLIDRDIRITFGRLLKQITFLEKIKILFSGFFIPKKELEKLNINNLLQEVEKEDDNSEIIEKIMYLFTKNHKKVKRILIDERDQFMAYQLKRLDFENVVVVVGAGHVKGIIKNYNKKSNINIKKIIKV